tara:strand:+ start:1287 stop:2624 length:1338 start_codon:yes stop_codon:yes gene_type:complete
MRPILIKNATIVNENSRKVCDVLIRDKRIEKIDKEISVDYRCDIIEAEKLFLIPGLIDDQVHFREPGLTHKGNIYTESMAAVAGGVTSFMEMPNTIPNAITNEELEKKYLIGHNNSFGNYSFYLGASNDNIEEVKRLDKKNICGVKIFMGSSTGNMLVDKERALNDIFKNSEVIITTHCEDEQTVNSNLKIAQEKYGDNIPFDQHPIIRSREACYKSSSHAISLAKEHNARLHVLHISTKEELELFQDIPLKEKNITCEACLHHMWFSDGDYEKLGSLIKWNPAIKTIDDREAIIDAVNKNIIDVIATDHAPHTLEEKSNNYMGAPSGGPLIQYSLPLLLEMNKLNKFSLEKIVQKTSHSVSELFQIKDRGYIREGYFADIVLFDQEAETKVSEEKILSKCNWSPLKNETFHSKIIHTIVSGQHIYKNGQINGEPSGVRMEFNRD